MSNDPKQGSDQGGKQGQGETHKPGPAPDKK